MPSLSSFLPTVKPGKSFSMRNAVMPLYPAAGSIVAKRTKRPASLRVGDPELAAVEDVVGAFELGAGLQGEGVGAGTGFAESVGADSVGGHLRQVALFLFGIAPAQQGVVDQRILHVDDDAGGGVDARQFLDREDGFEKLCAAAAVLLGDFDAHEAELEEFVDEGFVEDTLLVHFFYQRADALVGELADVIAEEDFVFGEGGEGRGNGLQRVRHRKTFETRMANL